MYSYNDLGRMNMGGTQQEAPDQQQMLMQQIAAALQKGTSPDMLLKALMDKGLDGEQAKSLISSVMQQLGGGEQQQMQQAPPQEVPAYGYGGMTDVLNQYSFGGQNSSSLYQAQDGFSVVDYLTSKKQGASKADRDMLAAKMGIKNYSGTAEQNLELLSKLKNNKTSGSTSSVNNNSFKSNFNNFPTTSSKVPYASSKSMVTPSKKSPQPSSTMTEGQRTASMIKAGKAFVPTWQKKESQPVIPNKAQAKKENNSGMAAIRAFNAANKSSTGFDPSAQQQPQLNPTNRKHSIKDLRESVESIPSNFTFGLPMNVSNYIKNRVAPNSNMSITNDNLSDEQKAILLQTIQRAQKRNKGATSGGADYIDYPTTIGQSAQGFMDNPGNLPDYISTPEGQLATTLGGFTYNLDPETGEYIVTDKYNFSNARDASRENKQGTGITGKLRKMADEDEAKNLAGERDSYWGARPNRRVGVILNPKTMTSYKKGGTTKGYSGTYSGGVYFGDGGGYYGGPVLQNYMKETSPMYNFGGYFPQGPRFDYGGEYNDDGFDQLPMMIQQKILRQRKYGGSYADGGIVMNKKGRKKHQDGGIVVGETYDASPEMLQKLKAGGYKFEYID